MVALPPRAREKPETEVAHASRPWARAVASSSTSSVLRRRVRDPKSRTIGDGVFRASPPPVVGMPICVVAAVIFVSHPMCDPTRGSREPPGTERERPNLPARFLTVTGLRGCWTVPAAVLILTAASLVRGGSFSSDECMDCHADAETVDGQEKLVVDRSVLAGSVHGDLECADCHRVDDIPHDESLPEPSCAECHDGSAEDYGRSVHGRAHAKGVSEAPSCARCHGGHDIRYVDDSTSAVSPRSQPRTCGTCHSDPQLVRKFYISVASPSEAYEKSAHYRALTGERRLAEGELADIEPPTCSTCHGGHLVLKASDGSASVNPGRVGSLCGRCHHSTLLVYSGSVHGKALEAGNRNAPTCAHCHGEHRIVSPEGGITGVELRRLSSETCIGCHSDQRLIQKTGLSALRVTSYEQSYHGLAGRLGSTQVAWCASCHGTHNILRADDPRSQVHPANLSITCGRCHEGIGVNFASIRVHSLLADEKATPGGFVRIAYLWMILLLIGGMAVHNAVVFSRYLREKYRAQKRFRAIRRWGRYMVAQHLILFISFTVLAMTGFALKFPTSWWVDLLQTVGLDEALRRMIHRVAAVVMVSQAVIQAFWFVLARDGRREIGALIPRYQDVLDLVQNIRYHLFRADHPPQYGRFDYAEKAEYLALIWGTAVMAMTGCMLWFPDVFTGTLPSWTIEVATVIHFYEAVLATLAIVVWHFFFVIYHPREYPMRLSWITGTLTEHDYRHHHGLEYEKLRNDPKAVIPPGRNDGPQKGHGSSEG